jgi:hypothetical protein
MKLTENLGATLFQKAKACIGILESLHLHLLSFVSDIISPVAPLNLGLQSKGRRRTPFLPRCIISTVVESYIISYG